MIQRIQTIWLLLACTAALLTLKFSFLAGQINGIGFELKATSEFYLLIASVGIALSALCSVFLFSNRKLQMKIVGIGLFMALLFTGYFLYAYLKNTYALIDAVITLGSVIYFVIPVFFLMALLAIRKDEQLIKSMDRLR